MSGAVCVFCSRGASRGCRRPVGRSADHAPADTDVAAIGDDSRHPDHPRTSHTNTTDSQHDVVTEPGRPCRRQSVTFHCCAGEHRQCSHEQSGLLVRDGLPPANAGIFIRRRA